MITKVNASSLDRVMSCAGSQFFTDLPKEEDSEQAKEGTAAGEYVERVIRKQFCGENIPTHAKNGVMFNEDMKFYGDQTWKEIRSISDSRITAEEVVDWQTRSGIWVKARYDWSFIGKDGALYMDDYKYGWGVVEAKGNWQLLANAIGEVIRWGQPVDKIVMRIHQPRPHHEEGPIRSWTISYAELLAFKEKIEARMDEIVKGNKDLVTGKYCRYCKAATACPAFNKSFFRGVEEVHSFIQDRISDSELSFQLDLVDRIEELVKNKASSLKALAVDRIKNGKLIPNYTTEISYGNRAWKTGITPVVLKTMTGLDVTKSEMLSPAQAEKMGMNKDLVSNLTERPFRGSNLKRSAVDAGNKIFGNAPPELKQ